MTLFKQVALLVSVIFLLLVIIITIGDIRRSGQFLEGQLKTTAQDMSTTLGVAITNSSNPGDIAELETLFNAVFDSGFYASIELSSPDGVLIHKKEQDIVLTDVPGWFTALVPLEPARGKALVMSGWTQLGKLSITLHPGYAYSGLYQSMVANLWWFSGLFILGQVLLWYLLHIILKPLRKVKQQADEIHNNRFIQQQQLPNTLELRRVVEAMNGMVSKVQSIFDDQEKVLGRYQKLLYIDSLTGLGNRKSVLDHLSRMLAEGSEFKGILAVIRINNINHFKEKKGYELSDSIIKKIAEMLSRTIDNLLPQQSARLSDDEFALILPATEDGSRNYLESIFSVFKTEVEQLDIDEELSLIAGIVSITSDRNVGDVLSESDYALSQAALKGPYTISQVVKADISLPQGKMAWRNWLEQSLADEKFFLVGQMVMDADGAALQQEVFLRLDNEQQETVSAGIFMPMALSLGLGLAIDKMVFSLVREIIDTKRKEPLALNLTSSFFSHKDALTEFKNLLDYAQISQTQLCIEASHRVYIDHVQICDEVIQMIKTSGHSFGVDNLELGQSLQFLQSIQADYVKVNANSLSDLASGDTQAGFQALTTLTNTLGIDLIAVGVDSQPLYDRLLGLGIHAMQGNLLGEPEEIL